MHLKRLTVKGFKSFASATTLEFEPGITCVVGPNGSGKSNVVDAIAWVMGEQGAKSLRGGKMEDVIFAGTSGRAPLGRAEVTLTIDNTDGALPIDYTEVSITRTLFRSGGSEYQINGEPCRLLDVQELLSDSGIGREMHVIVGQGRLDSILHATPEDRRGFIEEAAGVLKHRKRKEKALRKLDAMTANMARLQDLTTELKRQLKPLGRQAEVARRAAVIQSDVRDSRLRLYADDAVTLSNTLEQEEADEAALRDRRAQLESTLEAARERYEAAEREAQTATTQVAEANETHLRLTALRERFNGLQALATERARPLIEPQQQVLGPDPEDLDRQADQAQTGAAELATEVDALQADLEVAEEATSLADTAARQAQADDDAHREELASARERIAQREGSLLAARARLDARAAEIERLAESQVVIGERLKSLTEQVSALSDSDGIDSEQIDQAHAQLEAASARVAELTAAVAECADELSAARQERAGALSRIDALTLSLGSSASIDALKAANASVIGQVTDALRVQPGWEAAVEAAVAHVIGSDAVAVVDRAAARDLLATAATSDLGQVRLLIAGGATSQPAATTSGGLTIATVISAADGADAPAVCAAVSELVGAARLTDSISEAFDAVTRGASLAVTREGDVITNSVMTGGSGAPATRLSLLAALDEANAARVTSSVRCDERQAKHESLSADLVQAQVQHRECDEAHSALKQSVSAAQAESRAAASALQAAEDERARVLAAHEAALVAAQADQTAVDTAQTALAAVSGEQVMDRTEEFAARIADTRQATVDMRARETQVRLALRSAQERAQAATRRATELRDAAAAERESREQAKRRREVLLRRARTAQVVGRLAGQALAVLHSSVEQSEQHRDELTATQQRLAAERSELQAAVAEASSEIEKLTSDVHRDEMARTEQRLRIQQIVDKVTEDFGLGFDELVAEYGPERMVPPSAVAAGDEIDPDAPQAQPYPYVREEQEKRLRTAEKQLALLGRVNPLALEEFSAMEERFAFLNTQLDDLRASRKDLLDIVAEVDERVQQVFSEAFADVQREFAGVFSRLFPGGEGRLVLTDPSDLLTTGIEVEARPAGKKVKRLSLLSGGERSLTAVAFLVSLFKARPSPFYLLDEVEAALDDVNLGRLIGCLEELRESSQLLIITHQKRTMEIGDALYGITMRDGVTQVISQRIRELQPA